MNKYICPICKQSCNCLKQERLKIIKQKTEELQREAYRLGYEQGYRDSKQDE